MKTIFLFLFLFSNYVLSQDKTDFIISLKDSIKKDSIIKPWKLECLSAFNGSQTSFMNWNAGGRTNISLLGFISASADYKSKHLKWDNDLNLALGGMRYFDISKDKLQKTDDRIDIATNLGFNLKKHYYFSLIGGFKTQSLNGYSYPNDSVIITTFMAPGYVNLALGFDYVPSDNFGIFLSPLSSKFTYVRDQRLANLGSFGVDKAIYDGMGNLLTLGKRFRSEIGAYIKIKWNKTVAKNIEMKTRLELFGNYEHNPQNIDVNAEVIFTFKVNTWFAASLQLNTIYDDDIDIRDYQGKVGPRTQLKSVLGIGLSYTLKNQ